jgi:hypothetical protein
VVRAITAALEQDGYVALVAECMDDSARVTRVLEQFRGRRIDAVVTLAATQADRVRWRNFRISSPSSWRFVGSGDRDYPRWPVMMPLAADSLRGTSPPSDIVMWPRSAVPRPCKPFVIAPEASSGRAALRTSRSMQFTRTTPPSLREDGSRVR